MRSLYSLLFSLILFTSTLSAQAFTGFFDYRYDEKTGKIELTIKPNQLNQDFLYVSSLSAGIGSNDIGLDRGQLSGEKVVFF